MAYVRKKRVKGYEYYQLVESYRENGKVRQRMLEHLGEYPTVQAAIEGYSRAVEHYREISYNNEAIANGLFERYWEALQYGWIRRELPNSF